MSEEIQQGDIYKYKGNLYIFYKFVTMKCLLTREWVSAVEYANLKDHCKLHAKDQKPVTTYIRGTLEFLARFEKAVIVDGAIK